MNAIKNFFKTFFGSRVNAIKSYFKTLFTEEYEVTIWYEPTKQTVYNMKKIEKIDSKTLLGVLVTGEKFEMRVQNDFNFQVKKIH